MAFMVTFRAYDDAQSTVEVNHGDDDYFAIKDNGVLVVTEGDKQTSYSPATWMSVSEPIE